jgi:hypothetical protein
MWPPHGGKNQQWYHRPDGAIKSSLEGNMVLNVKDNRGPELSARAWHGGGTQIF